ncbi:hypothetical protein [Nonomuraea basaltis]|uniref:hypothetical protein n=1 Tax=Nonomuraea basaltis TaxID=2495887 RepID=UPI001485CC49|nr:hypothetical protein [Nonomuraea basaltis]
MVQQHQRRQGAALFALFAGMAESERECVREKSLEGQPQPVSGAAMAGGRGCSTTT